MSKTDMMTISTIMCAYSDIDECGQGNNTLCIKPAYCVNTVGSYECLCPEGYSGKGTNNDPCILELNTTHRGWYKLLVGMSIYNYFLDQ